MGGHCLGYSTEPRNPGVGGNKAPPHSGEQLKVRAGQGTAGGVLREGGPIALNSLVSGVLLFKGWSALCGGHNATICLHQ